MTYTGSSSEAFESLQQDSVSAMIEILSVLIQVNVVTSCVTSEVILSTVTLTSVVISVENKDVVLTSDVVGVSDDVVNSSCVDEDRFDESVVREVSVVESSVDKPAVGRFVVVSPSTGHVGRLLGFCDDTVSADVPQERVTSPVGFVPWIRIKNFPPVVPRLFVKNMVRKWPVLVCISFGRKSLLLEQS